VDDEAIGLFQQAAADWLSNGRTFAEQRYSPLARIDTRNVSKLGLAWQASLQSTMFGVESTPLVANGVIYTTSSYSRVFAFDAKTGSPLWTFDPKVARDRIRYGCCFAANRGVAIWKGKIFVGTYDGRLVALDALTGRKVWEVNTTGDVPYYTITGAPRVADGKVIIGNGGSDFGTRGFFCAYDAQSGHLAWRFYVVPDDPRKGVDQPELAAAARTWSADHDWSKGGDGNPWDSFSYDPEAGLMYVGTGNGVWVDQPGNVGHHLGLRRDTTHGVGRSQHRRPSQEDSDAGIQERVFLCARPSERAADLGHRVRPCQLGQGDRPQDGPTDHRATRQLRRNSTTRFSVRERSPQLARHGFRSSQETRLYPCTRRRIHLQPEGADLVLPRLRPGETDQGRCSQ
jgi:hypothetical protein